MENIHPHQKQENSRKLPKAKLEFPAPWELLSYLHSIYIVSGIKSDLEMIYGGLHMGSILHFI